MSGIEIALAVIVVLAAGLVVTMLYRRRAVGTVRAKEPQQPFETENESSAPERSAEVATAEATEFVLEDESGRRLFAELIEPTDSALRYRPDAVMTQQSSAVALDKVIETLGIVGMALKGGKWVRILNPEALSLGDQVESASGGWLAVIAGKDKKFVRQLRFSKPENLAAIATPLAVFKVASMVTGQYYLNRINSQLMTIEGSIREVRQDLRNETYGEITAAADTSMELEEGLALSLDLTSDERSRLVRAEGDIDKAYNQKRKDVQDFLNHVELVLSADRPDRRQLNKLISEANGTRMYDLQLLVYGAAVRHKLNILRAEVDTDAEGGRGELARLKLERELEEMIRDLSAASEGLAQLAVTRDEATEAWRLRPWQRPPRLLDQFHPRGVAMREQLADAPSTLLLTPSPVPTILEAYVDEQGLVQVLSATRPAEIEPPLASAEGRLLPAVSPDRAERRRLRLGVLKKRQTELEATHDETALRAVKAQIAELDVAGVEREDSASAK